MFRNIFQGMNWDPLLGLKTCPWMVRSFSVGNTRMNYLFTSLFSCDGFVFCLLFVVVVVFPSGPQSLSFRWHPQLNLMFATVLNSPVYKFDWCHVCSLKYCMGVWLLCILFLGTEKKMMGWGGALYCPVITHSTVLHSICILILYKSSACSMDLSEMDAQVYNKQGTSLCKWRKYYTQES